MKKLFFFIVVQLMFVSALFAQVGINTDNSDPDPSAMLDVKSTDKGFLPPRMTFTGMNAVASPASGLMVICTDCGSNGSGTLAMFANGMWFMFNANCLAPGGPVPWRSSSLCRPDRVELGPGGLGHGIEVEHNG